MNALIQVARDASPYLAVELLLPGGSVIALLLWLFRHRFKKGAGPLGTEVMRTLGLLGGHRHTPQNNAGVPDNSVVRPLLDSPLYRRTS
jgi:hypothetical protein